MLAFAPAAVTATGGLVHAVAAYIDSNGVDLVALGRATARVAPTVVLVPAFGLRALPVPARMGITVALAFCIAPALVVGPIDDGLPWPVALALEAFAGLPVALGAAIPLWVATMTGGVIDALRGAEEGAGLAVIEGKPTPLGALFGLLASAAFLATGGPARVAIGLSMAAPSQHAAVAQAAYALTAGVAVAVAVAAPIVAASIVLEVALALLGRAAAPTNVRVLVAQVRAVGLLVIAALLFEKIAAALEALGARRG